MLTLAVLAPSREPRPGVLWWPLAPRADFRITSTPAPWRSAIPRRSCSPPTTCVFALVMAGLGLLAGLFVWLRRRRRGVSPRCCGAGRGHVGRRRPGLAARGAPGPRAELGRAAPPRRPGNDRARSPLAAGAGGGRRSPRSWSTSSAPSSPPPTTSAVVTEWNISPRGDTPPAPPLARSRRDPPGAGGGGSPQFTDMATANSLQGCRHGAERPQQREFAAQQPRLGGQPCLRALLARAATAGPRGAAARRRRRGRTAPAGPRPRTQQRLGPRGRRRCAPALPGGHLGQVFGEPLADAAPQQAQRAVVLAGRLLGQPAHPGLQVRRVVADDDVEQPEAVARPRDISGSRRPAAGARPGRGRCSRRRAGPPPGATRSTSQPWRIATTPKNRPGAVLGQREQVAHQTPVAGLEDGQWQHDPGEQRRHSGNSGMSSPTGERTGGLPAAALPEGAARSAARAGYPGVSRPSHRRSTRARPHRPARIRAARAA